MILCERGIRTFESSSRFTLDLNSIPILKQRTHLPVIVDPSHGTGQRWLVPSMAKAAIAAGADGLLMEVHYRPEEALCDGSQALYPEDFGLLMADLRKVAEAVGRNIYSPTQAYIHSKTRIRVVPGTSILFHANPDFYNGGGIVLIWPG